MRRDEAPPTTLDYARDGGHRGALPAIVAFVVFQLGVACMEGWMLLYIAGVVRMFYASGFVLLLASCAGAVAAIVVSLVLPNARRGFGKVIAAIHGIFLLIVFSSFVYVASQPPRSVPGGGF
jgi:hypothetical protein